MKTNQIHTFLLLLSSCFGSLPANCQTSFIWFDNIGDARQNDIFFQTFSTTLFPDSTVQILYNDGTGNKTLGYVFTHGIGEIFDPKSKMYNNPIEVYNPYTVDSVAIAYKYNYVSQ